MFKVVAHEGIVIGPCSHRYRAAVLMRSDFEVWCEKTKNSLRVPLTVSHIHLVTKVAYDVFRQVIDGDVGMDVKGAAGHRDEGNWREPPRPNMNLHRSKSHTISPNDIKLSGERSEPAAARF